MSVPCSLPRFPAARAARAGRAARLRWFVPRLEEVEARLAPAGVLTYDDVDGDTVRIATSRGTANDLAGAVFLGPPTGLGQKLLQLDLTTNRVFAGADIAISAQPNAVGGDGFANVGYIRAVGIDLGTVLVDGDLGAIDVGDGVSATSACRGLTVQSLGRFGISTGAPSLASAVAGKLDKLTVRSDVFEASITATDSAGSNGRIGPVTVGGSVVGGLADGSGSINARDGLGPVTIRGDLAGGAGITSGAVTSEGNIAGISVGGSVRGGPGLTSGVVFSSLGAVGPVTIGRDILGGTGVNTGRVFGRTGLAAVTVGGSVRGGSAADTGLIHSDRAIGPVIVRGDVAGGDGARSGQVLANIVGGVTIGGSLLGGPGTESGRVAAGSAMGAVRITGSLRGGSNSGSGGLSSGGPIGPVRVGGNIAAGSSFGTGRVFANGPLAGLTIGGSLLGISPAPSSGSESGEVRSNGAMGPVTIAGDVVGGRIGTTGRVFASGPLASVSIGGSLIGGADRNTGEVLSEGPMGPVRIGGDIVGGFPRFSGPGGTGYVQGRRIASLFVGGSIRAGSEASGPGARSGSVRAAEDIGPITVRGSLLGDAETPVVISARGQAAPIGPADVAIRSLTVGDRVAHALILAGYDTTFVGVNGDAQVGAVAVGGDWVASRLAAGTGVGDDKTPGTPDDTFLGGGRPGVVSKIASIAIGGQALGTVGGADSFGLLAEKVGSLTIGGTVVPLTAGSDDRPVGATGDLRVVDAA